MADDTVQRFIDGLRKLEADGDVDELAGLYGPESLCGNTATTTTHQGPEGAREFWSGYRKAFDEIRSEFREAIQDGDAAALEWVTEARLRGGEAVRYEGVTVLEIEGGAVRRSTAYFDPRALVGPT